MKKFYIILIALFMASSAGGQDSISVLPFDASAVRSHPAHNPQLQTSEQQTLIQKNDSIYCWFGFWTEYSGYVYSVYWKIIDIVYDTDNNLISKLFQTWNFNDSAWENANKYFYTYDANNNMTSELRQDWYEGAWVDKEKYIYNYDANNNLTSELRQTSYFSSTLENYSFITFTYDANNNLTLWLRQEWSGFIWLDWQRHIYTYDTNNNMTKDSYQTFYKYNYWATDTLNTYTFDTNNNQTSWLKQEFGTGFKKNYKLYTYNYDSQNNMTSEVWQDWYEGAWENIRAYTYSYDANNYLISKLLQFWFQWGWGDNRLETYTYDANYNLTGVFSYIWFDNTWFIDWQYIYTYDENNFKISDSYDNLDSWSGVVSIANELDTRYYLQTIFGINDLTVPSENVSIYPNPFSISSTIEYELNHPERIVITFYNHLGELVDKIQTDQPQGLNKVIWTPVNLPNGIYHFRIQAGEQVASGKVVLLK